MRNICILKLEKNENGFFTAAQTAAAACLRSSLKLRGINSMMYTDDTLPSLNDLAEDILSVCDDALAVYADEENKVLVNALTHRLKELEDIDIVLMSGAKPEEALMEFLTEDGEAGDDGEAEKAEALPIMEVSPYEQKILLPQDAEKYGIWYGRETISGEKEYRSPQAIETDIRIIIKAYEGLARENKKLIPCEGAYIAEREYLETIIKLFPAEEASLRFICPVDGKIMDVLTEVDSDALLWKICLTEECTDETSLKQLSALIAAGKVYGVKVTAEALKKMDGIPADVAAAVRENRLKDSAARYVPFSRGFLKSRTGVYTGVPLDGYVKHIEVLTEEMNDEERRCLNELASINSSVYMRNSSTSFEEFRQKNMEADVIESNLLRIEDDRLLVNDLAYTSPQKIKEIPYAAARGIIEEMEQAFGTQQACFYVFTMDTAGDYEAFLEDAETFREKHTFEKMPLAFGYLKNYCRFLNSNSCFVDKMPRIQLKGDGNVYVCSNFKEPVGTCSQAVFELTQSCYVKKENLIKERGCVSCIARSWCAKCTQLPEFMKDSYCHIIKTKTYVIDYLMSSIVYIDMSSTIPRLKSVRPQDVQVTSEYMFNLTSKEEKGKELPYFPKFSYMFICADQESVLWSAASAKFFRVSPQFSLVCEMLFKRFSPERIRENMKKLMNITEEEACSMYDSIADTLNKSGAMYRPIEGQKGGEQ